HPHSTTPPHTLSSRLPGASAHCSVSLYLKLLKEFRIVTDALTKHQAGATDPSCQTRLMFFKIVLNGEFQKQRNGAGEVTSGLKADPVLAEGLNSVPS
ncbi:mCG120576, isoform CRA_a, partial [Mus musculus]